MTNPAPGWIPVERVVALIIAAAIETAVHATTAGHTPHTETLATHAARAVLEVVAHP